MMVSQQGRKREKNRKDVETEQTVQDQKLGKEEATGQPTGSVVLYCAHPSLAEVSGTMLKSTSNLGAPLISFQIIAVYSGSYPEPSAALSPET